MPALAPIKEDGTKDLLGVEFDPGLQVNRPRDPEDKKSEPWPTFANIWYQNTPGVCPKYQPRPT
ncbi:hypothetical protein LXL04_002357 [Taraxacum kok-saghyz]